MTNDSTSINRMTSRSSWLKRLQSLTLIHLTTRLEEGLISLRKQVMWMLITLADPRLSTISLTKITLLSESWTEVSQTSPKSANAMDQKICTRKILHLTILTTWRWQKFKKSWFRKRKMRSLKLADKKSVTSQLFSRLQMPMQTSNETTKGLST